jgi:hypothetical protein
MNARLARNLANLYAFYLVGLNGSNKKASIELGISSPSVSDRVSQIAELCKNDLTYVYGGREIKLTIIGEEIFRRIQAPMKELENIMLEMSQGVFREARPAPAVKGSDSGSHHAPAGTAQPGERERDATLLPRQRRQPDDDRSM